MKKLLLALLVSSCMTPRHLPKDLPPLTVPLVPYQGALRVVEVGINSVQFRFLLDTAAAVSVVSPEVARHGDCALIEGADRVRVMGQLVDAPQCNHLVVGLSAWATTLDQVNVYDVNAKLPEGWPKLDGVLALDAFAPHALSLDFLTNRIVLDTNGTLAARDAASAFPIRVQKPVNGRGTEVQLSLQAKAWFTVDTTLAQGALVSKAAAERLALPLEPERKAWASLSFGKSALSVQTALGNDATHEALLGMEALDQHVLTFDFKNARGWLR